MVRRADRDGSCSIMQSIICISIRMHTLSLQRRHALFRSLSFQRQVSCVELPRIELFDGHLDGQDVVTQTAVEGAAVPGGDGGALCPDQPRSSSSVTYLRTVLTLIPTASPMVR